MTISTVSAGPKFKFSKKTKNKLLYRSTPHVKTLSLCPHQDLASLKVCQGPVDQPRPPVPDKLVTSMFTNPTAVHLTIKICDFVCKHIGNPVTDMLTNPTVVHLHIDLHDCYAIHIANLVTSMLTKLTVVHLHYKTYGFYGSSHGKPWHRHVCKPYSCSVART